MAYYPPPNEGQGYPMAYYGNPPHSYESEQYNRPAPFPVDNYGGPPGPYPQPGPGQYAPPGPGPYQSPGPLQYVPPGPGPVQYPPPEPGQPYGQGYGQPGYGGGPVINQPVPPMDGDWMATARGIPNCPPGLELLMSLSSLFVKQKVEILEALTGFETNNKYTIKNDRGEKIYWAVEDTDICTRMCCGSLRPFLMRVFDAEKREVIHLRRKCACSLCCFPCCMEELEVFAPPDNFLGSIKQNWSLFFPWFSIKDASGTTVLKIQGPFCAMPLCGQAEFQVLSKDRQVQVGKISKEWSGFMRELFTDADYFGVSFPMDLDVRMKAVMIGAVFLIDAMYFEKSN